MSWQGRDKDTENFYIGNDRPARNGTKLDTSLTRFNEQASLRLPGTYMKTLPRS